MKHVHPPIAIAITWSKEMIQHCGGPFKFYRHFLQETFEDGTMWLQKCKHAPKHDILHVYVIIGGHVRFKLYYAGHESGEVTVTDGNGEKQVSWPRIVMAGPVEKAPYKIPMRGFQGFRYIYEPLF